MADIENLNQNLKFDAWFVARVHGVSCISYFNKSTCCLATLNIECIDLFFKCLKYPKIAGLFLHSILDNGLL